MKRYLRHRSRRWGYDGWALRIVGAPLPLEWTVCTNRAETRELKRELEERDPEMFDALQKAWRQYQNEFL